MTENNISTAAPATSTVPAKSYSFLNIKKCVGRDDKLYHGVTVSGMVVNPDSIAKTASGREYLRFSMPIQNQGPRIWRACEIQPEADSNGTVWANVTFWGNGALRFARYLEKHPRSIIVVTGSLRVEKTTAANGATYTNTNISADDFMHVRDVPMKKAKDESTESTLTAPAPAPTSARTNTSHNAGAPAEAVSQHNEYVELEPEGDLPF